MPKITIQAFVSGNFHAVWCEPELVQDRGVDVDNVVWVFHGVESQFVGRTMNHTAAESAAIQTLNPNGW